MKKLFSLIVLVMGLNLSTVYAANEYQQIFANNWETIDKQLQSLIGQPEYIVLLALGVPSATDVSFGWKTAAWNVVPVSGKILKDIVPVLIK